MIAQPATVENVMNTRTILAIAAAYFYMPMNASAQPAVPASTQFQFAADDSTSGIFSVATFVRDGHSLSQSTMFVDWTGADVFLLTVDNEQTPEAQCTTGH